MTANTHIIRIFIIDNHPLIILGLKSLLRSSRDGLKVTGSAKDIEETLKNAEPDEFDIIVLGILQPRNHHLKDISILKEKYPKKPIVILTSEESVIWNRKMVMAGVQGYISNSADKTYIKYVLKRVGEGEVVFTFPRETPIGQNRQVMPSDGVMKRLTSLQLECIWLVSEGYTHQQVADKQGCSTSTINKTFSRLRKEFNVKNNAALIAILITNKWI